jgi:hypothetical protein
MPACALDPDSDLGDRLVTVDVGPLSAAEIDAGLAAGVETAEDMIEDGLLRAAVLVLADEVRLVGHPGASHSALRMALQNHSKENRVHA